MVHHLFNRLPVKRVPIVRGSKRRALPQKKIKIKSFLGHSNAAVTPQWPVLVLCSLNTDSRRKTQQHSPFLNGCCCYYYDTTFSLLFSLTARFYSTAACLNRLASSDRASHQLASLDNITSLQARVNSRCPAVFSAVRRRWRLC